MLFSVILILLTIYLVSNIIAAQTTTTQFDIHETVNPNISEEEAKANKIVNDEIGGKIIRLLEHFVSSFLHISPVSSNLHAYPSFSSRHIITPHPVRIILTKLKIFLN